MSSKIPNETSCEIFGFFSNSECQNQLVVSSIHYSLIAPRLEMVYCYLNRKKLQKIRLNSYIDSPDYPEDFDLQLSGLRKVMEDVHSLSHREVSISMDRVVLVHTQLIGARTAPLTGTDDGGGCYVWTKTGRTSTKNRIEQGYFRCSGCQARNELSAYLSKVTSLKFNIRLQH
uniref:Uncharacterized protein n=1 Tax=Ditylenchus dipsaci TaxID=166011 RepID=A0A915EM47_9BILA